MLTWFNSWLNWQKTIPRKKEEKKVVIFCQIHELNLLSSEYWRWNRDWEDEGSTGLEARKRQQDHAFWHQLAARRAQLSHQSPSPHTGGQQEKTSSPVLHIVPIMRIKVPRGAWCWLLLSKNENKVIQKCLFGLVSASRDTCTFAFPLYRFAVQTHATLQKRT